MERFGWYGWSDGADDCDPPEPGKEWLTITQYGDEVAIIVHRTDTTTLNEADSERHRLQKERRAQAMVDALNASYREPDMPAADAEREALRREARQEALLDAGPILAEHRRLKGE